MNGQPIRTEINNGVLSSTNAMPLKNLTSDNTPSFSNNRQLFQKAYQPPADYSVRQTTRSFFNETQEHSHMDMLSMGRNPYFKKNGLEAIAMLRKLPCVGV